MTSPTARTLSWCKKQGFIPQVVEKYNQFSMKRIDLFGIIDIVAITPVCILGIQTTSRANMNARIKKALAEPRLFAWLRAGGKFEVHGWSKKGKRNERKLWKLTREVFVKEEDSVRNYREADDVE